MAGSPPKSISTLRHARWLAAAGSLCAAAGVALSAYAAHAAAGDARAHLQLAAIFLFGHGVALTALADGACSRFGTLALCALAAGTLLFAGSLTLHVLLDWPAMLAPAGGMLLIAGWLALAIDRLRG